MGGERSASWQCCKRQIETGSTPHRLVPRAYIYPLQSLPGKPTPLFPPSPLTTVPMVYVPGITKTLARRKGGGKNKGGKSGSSSSSSGKKSPKSTSNLPMGKKSATMYGNGGGPVSTITSGVFAGRTAGGGTRASVFGNRFGRVPFFDTG